MELSVCAYSADSTGLKKQFLADVVITEEPLQLSLRYYDTHSDAYLQKVLLVMMRTPGDDKALIIGFLFSEGIIRSINDIVDWQFDDKYNQQHEDNAVVVTLNKQLNLEWQKLSRHFINHSSCGICGKTLLNALSSKHENSQQTKEATPWIAIEKILALPKQLFNKQTLFQKTGGSHAVSYIVDHEIIYISEDIGRHNAVDKVIGHALMNNKLHSHAMLLLSGRVSLELMQKAVAANINVIIAIGAPSSLAVKVARQFDLTLIGFVKKDRCNVYHGKWRIAAS